MSSDEQAALTHIKAYELRMTPGMLNQIHSDNKIVFQMHQKNGPIIFEGCPIRAPATARRATALALQCISQKQTQL